MNTWDIDPLPLLRERAIPMINAKFAALTFRDVAHTRKRETAQLIAVGTLEISKDHPFAKEAKLRKLTPKKFATLIVSKPDVIQERELQRQTLLIAVENAKTVKDIEEVLLEVGKM